MIKRRNKQYLAKGFTLIEALVLLFVFSITVATFYSVFTVGMKNIIQSKNRLGAIALANEKMEIIRNLKYDDVGIAGGIPSGNLVAEEDVAENSKNYHVKTLVQFVDDSLDGVFPDDTMPTDYKIVKVNVSWDIDQKSGEVNLVSRFVPPGLEIMSGDGVLAINVIDNEGNGIAQTTVHIINNTVSPAVDLVVQTDNSGNLMFPGAKESIQKYKLIISKNEYETISTLDPNEVSYDPIDIHASVVSGLLNVKTIVQNLTANLKIVTKDISGNKIEDVGFDLEGGRILGTSGTYGEIKTYNLEGSYSTDSNGEKEFNNISPGEFDIDNLSSVSGYTQIGTDPAAPFFIAPGKTETVEIKFADNSVDSLLVSIKGPTVEISVEGAEARLFNGDGFDETLLTLSDGRAFFPSSGTLSAGSYSLEIKAAGFQDYSSSVNIDNLTTKEVLLELSP
ncbi:MAG: hypothetical protein COU40_00100 [Candidatus Moranbacteria bacterium CG10_big_fil_rev_8_21_14_0_10_35_21]|nr:MAG: hypothetical protein COU40_00100 [Candidatus Moranbacteria bacterium CG10_big_fil_rev_8_21_14_0_10_35_21]PJA88459.1 MAG: hypothetical protein CO139_03065 [Candidatus Moranbacteria bacterium CG_4_9_14_3_um_filter_36_9]